MRTPVPSLSVRDTTAADVANAPGLPLPIREEQWRVTDVCVSVLIGGRLVGIMRTDDYPGELLWSVPGTASAVRAAVDAWCDLLVGNFQHPDNELEPA